MNIEEIRKQLKMIQTEDGLVKAYGEEYSKFVAHSPIYISTLLSIIDKQEEEIKELKERNEAWKRQFESEMEWFKPNLTLVRKEDEPK